jgi:hypothetical protein
VTEAVAVPSMTLVYYNVADADADPSNNFDGTGTFLINPESLHPVTGYPLVQIDGSIDAAGALYAGPDTISMFMYLGSTPSYIEFVNAQTVATLTDDGTIIDGMLDGELGGVVPVAVFHAVANPAGFGPPTVAGLMAALGIQPDVDLDGDGLETIEAGLFTGVTECNDPSSGGTITGADCPAELEDGWSAAFRFTAVHGTVTGVAP